MVGNRCKISIKDNFRGKNKNTVVQNPINDFFSIIPSWNKEFVCLVGLEEVVQFRLEWLDKTVSTAPKKHRGKKNLSPVPDVVPATPPKDPYTCAKCTTDVSSSWKHDINRSILCHSCFMFIWRKDHWFSSEPVETVISQPVWIKPQSMKEAAFPLQHSSRSIPQECDQQVPKNSISSSFNLHPDSPFYCSSPLSSELSSSPPEFCMCYSSSSCSSSLCHDSLPSHLLSSLDLTSSSTSSSGSPQSLVSQKFQSPHWIETFPPKAFLQDDKAEQEIKKEKEEQWTRNKPECKESKTRKIALPSSLSKQQILPNSQSVLPESKPSPSPMLSFSRHEFQTRTPNLQKATTAEGLKPGNLLKVSPNVSHGYVSSTTLGSSNYTSDSGKAKSTIHYPPTTWSNISGSVRQQDSMSIPRCFCDDDDDDKRVHHEE